MGLQKPFRYCSTTVAKAEFEMEGGDGKSGDIRPDSVVGCVYFNLHCAASILIFTVLRQFSLSQSSALQQ
jgi:hypothetical protein